ncbi:hypothetical protein AAG570_010254 [Ranatra chinensis]|uniref:Stealth protein CR4 conserved region 4 domain-containing protein n=1 Tax=Ranatra chinensis TaxID=642074 RepID=A0ABD0YY43_9HEMI
MQFSFSYFYFLMSEKIDVPREKLFDMFDTDSSGTWSDREIRTILTRLYSLPLNRVSVLHFETMLKQCAKPRQNISHLYERYLDSNLKIMKQLEDKFGTLPKYPYDLVKSKVTETVSAFHMIPSNVTTLLTILDAVRSRPMKFICLNDDMGTEPPNQYEVARAILLDFYYSMLPHPSQFELDPEYRNRFLYYDDLMSWHFQRTLTYNVMLYAIIALLVLMTFYCCKPEVTHG